MNNLRCMTTQREIFLNDSQASPTEHANVNFPPPFIHGVGIFSAIGVEQILPGVLPAPENFGWLGFVMVSFSLFLALMSFREFNRAKNPVPPNQPIQSLMTSGPFRFSRNPLYVALAFLHGGIAFLSGNTWILTTLPLTLLFVRYYVISREEAYLVRRFGQTYLEYMARVRRWL